MKKSLIFVFLMLCATFVQAQSIPDTIDSATAGIQIDQQRVADAETRRVELSGLHCINQWRLDSLDPELMLVTGGTVYADYQLCDTKLQQLSWRIHWNGSLANLPHDAEYFLYRAGNQLDAAQMSFDDAMMAWLMEMDAEAQEYMNWGFQFWSNAILDYYDPAIVKLDEADVLNAEIEAILTVLEAVEWQ